MKFKRLIAVLVVLSALLGCQQAKPNQAASAQKLNVVATTTMLDDLVKQIGQDKVDVIGLMGPGVDPHLYQASAGDVSKLEKADVVVINGLHLEGKMGEIFASLQKQDKNIINLEDHLDHSKILNSEDDAKTHDPHIWFSVDIWKDAAKIVADQLSKFDNGNAKFYQTNYDAYLKELEELDTYIKDRVNELPEQQRVLVTAHDAFQYFGRDFKFQVKGLQGISTESQAATSDLTDLATFIAENKIKAIFVESSIPPKTIEALQEAVKAKGFEVAIGGELYSDSLGDEKTGHETYIKTLKANIDTIVNALK